MANLGSWKKFIVDNYRSLTNEVWQLGSDAKTEAANIFSELTHHTSDIYNDLATADYTKVTEGERKAKQTANQTVEYEQNENGDENASIKLKVFSVESYSKDSNPAIIGLTDDIENEKTTTKITV